MTPVPSDPAGIAVRAAGLGVLLGSSLCYALLIVPTHPELPLYLAIISLFHLLEYWTQAKFNTAKVNNECIYRLCPTLT